MPATGAPAIAQVEPWDHAPVASLPFTLWPLRASVRAERSEGESVHERPGDGGREDAAGLTHEAPRETIGRREALGADARRDTFVPLRIAVVGAGAVGGTVGGRLLAAGHEVWFVARGATRDRLASEGLRVDSVDGDLRLAPVAVTHDPAQIGAVDLVLVCVKATQVAEVAPTLVPLLGPQTVVLPTQNGVEASAHLAAALGAGPVLDGVCRVIAEQVAPGHIRHGAVTPVLEFGPRAGTTLSTAVAATTERVAAALRAAGLQVVRPAQMALALWEKFLFIEPIGSVGAATRRPFGVVRTVPATRALLDAALDEVLAVGQAAGVAWSADSKRGVWARYEKLPAGEFTSMARDLLAGRAGEFEAQTGAVVRLARMHGVPVPVHDALYALLLPAALGA